MLVMMSLYLLYNVFFGVTLMESLMSYMLLSIETFLELIV